MPLSGLPSGGPTIPAGATRVTLKEIDVAATAAQEDVTDLLSEEREYAAPPLVDGAGNSPTATCSATGFLKGSAPEPTPTATTTGWICEDAEEVYEVGKYATWSANWSYYPPEE